MQGLTVLIADDDAHVQELSRIYLGREGARVVAAGTGEEALACLDRCRPDVVILDVMMPGLDGFAVCREIRRQSDVPVLMLTARGEEVDRVLGLELGADDYITKPFSPRELVARIRAILRRARPRLPAPEAGVLVYPGLTIDVEAREVTAEGQPVALAPREFDLLAYLARNPRRAFTREHLLTTVWGYDFGGDTRTVDVHIKKLRQKLGEPGRQYLQTVWGVGYKFEVPRHAPR